MIIDFHSHDFPDEIAVRAMNGMCRKTDGKLWSCGDGTLANHLDFMDLAGVDRAVSCPIATKPNQFDVILRRARQIRDGELGERVRQRIVPFASIHPRDPDAVAHLEAIAAAGLKGVKFHCYYQDFSLADRTLWPVFAKIRDLGLVTLCHCGADIAWDMVGLCGPREIEALLKNVRGLTFVAAHLGGCDGYPPHETDRLLDCGAYIDTAMLHRRCHYDEPMRVLRSWPTDRILFGTDFPWETYPDMIRWVKSVRDPRDWDALFGGNARRLLGLTA